LRQQCFGGWRGKCNYKILFFYFFIYYIRDSFYTSIFFVITYFSKQITKPFLELKILLKE